MRIGLKQYFSLLFISATVLLVGCGEDSKKVIVNQGQSESVGFNQSVKKDFSLDGANGKKSQKGNSSDGRYDGMPTSRLTDTGMIENAEKVFAVLVDSNLRHEGDRWILDSYETVGQSRPYLCDSHPLHGELNIVHSTGFALNDSIVALSGHAVCRNDQLFLSDLGFVLVYGFYDYSTNPNGSIVFPDSNVYRVSRYYHSDCGEQDLVDAEDYAFYGLERKIPQRLILADTGTVQPGDSVYSMGFPLGSRLRLNPPGVVLKSTSQAPFHIRADIDNSDGDSGGPVFDSESNKLVGIFVSGGQDFSRVEQDSCHVYRTHSLESCQVRIMPVGVLIDALKNNITN